jgi:ATP synthase protein I
VNNYTKWDMKEENKKYIRQLANASTIGFQVAFSIFIGLGIGVWLDSKMGTFPWLALLFLVLGVIAGFLNMYRFARKQQREESTKD